MFTETKQGNPVGSRPFTMKLNHPIHKIAVTFGNTILF